MSRFFELNQGFYLLSGDTFSVKDNLKSAGAKWNAAKRQWVMPASDENKLFLEKLRFFEACEQKADQTAITIQTTIQAASQTMMPAVDRLEGKTWTVLEIANLMQRAVTEIFVQQIWVAGEVSSLKQSNGHCYFELSAAEKLLTNDALVTFGPVKNCALSCVLWHGRRRQLEEQRGDLAIAEGTEVRILVAVEFRKETGKLSLVVADVDTQFAMGKMALQRAQIVRELRKRGIYGLNKTVSMDVFPLKIALITAESSRAKSDFLDELKLSGLSFCVSLFDCNMQGERTSGEIAHAFQEIEKRHSDFAAVVVTRGGGSRLDLRWFDDLEIAKAISYCKLPVITAIGHFEDISVADEVAFRAEKTPTAAARFLVDSTHRDLDNLIQRFESSTHTVRKRLTQSYQQLERFKGQLLTAARMRLAREQNALQGYEQTLRILKAQLVSPLRRGFALLRWPEDNGKGIPMGVNELRNSRPEIFQLELFDKSTQQHLFARVRLLDLKEQTEEKGEPCAKGGENNE